jgi:hypothetical protein
VTEDYRVRNGAWVKKLADRAGSRPPGRKYGGAGMSVMEQFIFNQEMASAKGSAR